MRALRLLTVFVAGWMGIAGVATLPTASAHEESIDDGDDTPGPLDIASASVVESSRSVTHTISTFASWTTVTLGRDSYFVLLIDTKGSHRNYERCAFAFISRGQLRGVVTDCGDRFRGRAHVSKPDPSSVSLRLPVDQFRQGYRYAVASVYLGPGRCRRRCVDTVPNTFPLLIHDLEPPTIALSPPGLLSDAQATDAFDTLDLTIHDEGGSGVGPWSVEQAEVGGAGPVTIATGSGGGGHSATPLPTVEGSTYGFTVQAEDGQGNARSKTAFVAIPLDDASSGLPGSFGGSWTTDIDSNAYLGAFHLAAAEDAVLSMTIPIAAGYETTFVWVAPGWGSWTGRVTVDQGVGPTMSTVKAMSFADLPRQRVFSQAFTPGVDQTVSIVISVPAGGGAVPVDAIGLIVKPLAS